MKITETDYQELRRMVIAFRQTDTRTSEELTEVYQSRQLSPKRMRWDIARAALVIPYINDVLYKYLEDTHIDTALRTVMRSVGLPFAAQK